MIDRLSVTAARLPWLVGETNLDAADRVLYPYPAASTGGRLCHLVLGLDPDEYLARFERRCLLRSTRWLTRKARAAADLVRLEADGAPLILLGARVARAFGVEYLPFVVRRGDSESPTLVLPHPSGLLKAWSDPGAYARARAMVKEISR